MKVNLYKILGIRKTSDKNKIKSAYRNKCKTCHPDQGGNQEEFIELNKAYKILMDDEMRIRYDNGENIENLHKPVNDKILQIIAINFSQALDQIDCEDQDIIKIIKNNLRNAINNFDQEIHKAKLLKENYENCLKRIKHKDQENILSSIIHGKIISKEEFINKFKNERECFNQAIQVLEEYSYDFEEIKTSFNSFNYNPFATSTTTSV